MTEAENKLKEEFRILGFILPEWLIRQNPTIQNIEGQDYFVTSDGVYFDAEQFRIPNVLYRWNLISKHSN